MIISSSSKSAAGISDGSNKGLLGNGEGHRGPIGRRSVDSCDVEREGPDSLPRLGVVGLMTGVVERRLGASLDILDVGRTGKGGSSEITGEINTRVLKQITKHLHK